MNPEELKHIAVLKAMDSESLGRLAAALEERVYADGQTVFAEGDPGEAMFFIASGSVQIEKQTGADPCGRETLAVLEAGDYFGEMSLFDRKPRSASAVASGPTRLLRLSQAAFDAFPKQGSQAGMGVLFAMIRTSDERIRCLNAQVIVYEEIGKAIGESQSLEQLLDTVLRQLCRATLADWGLVALRAQFSELFEVRSAVNVQLSSAERKALAGGQGFWAAVFRDARDRVVHSIREEEPFKSCASPEYETVALLLASIQVENKSLGLIVLGSRQIDQFKANHLNLARGVARQTAHAILNARHREEEAARARHAKQFVRF